MNIAIAQERPDTPDAVQLINELEDVLDPLYPGESRHGYSVQKLIDQGVAFFVLRVADNAAACGGVQFFSDGYGEVKRMYVRPAYRGRGFAGQILARLEAHSIDNGFDLLRLETGIYQKEAIGLYEKLGFKRIDPFGDYRDDPLSVFFEKQLHV